jgi:signal transduction histidine kinase
MRICIDVDESQAEKLSSISNERDMSIENFIKNLVEGHIRGDLEFRDLAANLSHQLLIPIQSIIAIASDLQDRLADTELENEAEELTNNIIKLSYIADNLRGYIYSPRQKDKSKFQTNEIDIVEPINKAIKLFRNEASRKGIEIATPKFMGDATPKLEISEYHLEMILYNLISNAVKYSFSPTENFPSSIEIIGNVQDQYYCINIINYGSGLLPEEIDKGLVFQKGYRGILSRDMYRISSGLGLSTIKEIIDIYGGKIEIDSRKINDLIKFDLYKTSIKVCLPRKGFSVNESEHQAIINR